MEPTDALIQLAADLFPETVDDVRAAVADPPRTTEEVGFYLRGNESDFELSFRTAVTRFCECKHVWGFEDKYVHEMIATWQDAKILPKKLATEITEVLDPFSEGSIFSDVDSSPNANIFTALRDKFPVAVTALEEIFDERDETLLSFELSGGDTIFFVVVDKSAAEPWRDVRFWDEPELGVRSADWLTFWNFFGYACGIPMSVGEPEIERPPLRTLST